MGLSSDSKSPTFVEDTAVRVEDLPAYIADFRKILKKHDTNCVFYAHASVGELHLRPMINLLKPGGAEKMKRMAEEVAELVSKYRGSLSGEHGDGRARSPYIEKVLGSEAMPLLRAVKHFWDPTSMFNPNKIVRPKPIDMDLRFTPDKQIPVLNTVFKWRREKGYHEAMKLCNGAGACRKIADSGGTMCPSYMATLEEKESTRGRANLFRQYFTERGEKGFTSPEIKSALDLCLSCKACKTECPANVDMARMKAEFMQGWYDENGTPLSARFFGEAASLYPFASLTPRLANRVIASDTGKDIFKRLFGIDPRRNLPSFADVTLRTWHKNRDIVNERSDRVLLFADPFINYHEPEIGIAATQVLEKMGYRVMLGDHLESGRTQISKGLLKKAKIVAETNIERLFPYAEKEIPIIGLEPSEILTLSDEYLELCDDDLLDKARVVAEMAISFENFVDSNLSAENKHVRRAVSAGCTCTATAMPKRWTGLRWADVAASQGRV
jgi:Fe-S oxidoreductase